MPQRHTYASKGWLYLNGAAYPIGKEIFATCSPDEDGTEQFKNGRPAGDSKWTPSVELGGKLYMIESNYGEPLSIYPYIHYCGEYPKKLSGCTLRDCPNFYT
jgi:hypothetical protein